MVVTSSVVPIRRWASSRTASRATAASREVTSSTSAARPSTCPVRSASRNIDKERTASAESGLGLCPGTSRLRTLVPVASTVSARVCSSSLDNPGANSSNRWPSTLSSGNAAQTAGRRVVPHQAQRDVGDVEADRRTREQRLKEGDVRLARLPHHLRHLLGCPLTTMARGPPIASRVEQGPARRAARGSAPEYGATRPCPRSRGQRVLEAVTTLLGP